MLKFHLDENVDNQIAIGLRSRGFDCTTSGEAGLLSADDPEQLEYCLREGRVIVSHDADMLRHAAAGVEHAGVAWCQMHRRSIGSVVMSLLNLNRKASPEAMRNRVEYI